MKPVLCQPPLDQFGRYGVGNIERKDRCCKYAESTVRLVHLVRQILERDREVALSIGNLLVEHDPTPPHNGTYGRLIRLPLAVHNAGSVRAGLLGTRPLGRCYMRSTGDRLPS